MKNRIILFAFILVFISLLGCGAKEEEVFSNHSIQGTFQSPKKFIVANRLHIQQPVIMAKPGIPVFEPYTTISANDLVVINNASYTDVSFINGGETLDTYPGKYRTTVEARDNYGNTKSVDVEFTVREPEGYLDPEPEAIQRIKQDGSMPEEYKDFLLNNTTVTIGSHVDFGIIQYPTCQVSDSPKTGDALTLEDICYLLSDTEDASFQGVKYGLLDCGMDGKPELALHFDIAADERLTAILSMESGKLIMTHLSDSFGRDYEYFYTDGCYFSHVFGNASGVFYDFYIFDKYGMPHFVYSYKSTVSSLSRKISVLS